MPIMDRSELFSDRQAITATTASTNSVNLGAARTFNGGSDVPMTVSVTESFNNLTSLTISVQTDDSAAFSSPVTVFTTTAIPLADLAAGKRLLPPYRLPFDIKEQYVRLMYTVAGTAPTTGRITAGVSMGNQTA